MSAVSYKEVAIVTATTVKALEGSRLRGSLIGYLPYISFLNFSKIAFIFSMSRCIAMETDSLFPKLSFIRTCRPICRYSCVPMVCLLYDFTPSHTASYSRDCC